MSTHFAPFSITSQRRASASRGAAVVGATHTVVAGIVPLLDEPGSSSPSKIGYLDPGPGRTVGGLEAATVGNSSAVSYARTTDVAAWLINRTTTDPSTDGAAVELLSNSEPTIIARAPVDVGGLLGFSHRPAVRVKGAALTAMGTTPPTALVAQLEVLSSPVGLSSLAVCGSFVDSTTGTTVAADLLLSSLRNASGNQYILGLGASNVPVIVNGANFATVSPYGVVWIDGSDIGNANYQIPPDGAANQASRYLFHPAYFQVSNKVARSVVTTGEWVDPITSPDGTPTIYQSTDDWTHSAWRLSFDGAQLDVVLSHDGTTGLRRPRDVYQAILYPDVLNGARVNLYRTMTTPTTRSFIPIGVIDSFRYMDYALFLEAYKEAPALPYSQFVQLGAASV